MKIFLLWWLLLRCPACMSGHWMITCGPGAFSSLCPRPARFSIFLYDAPCFAVSTLAQFFHQECPNPFLICYFFHIVSPKPSNQIYSHFLAHTLFHSCFPLSSVAHIIQCSFGVIWTPDTTEVGKSFKRPSYPVILNYTDSGGFREVCFIGAFETVSWAIRVLIKWNRICIPYSWRPCRDKSEWLFGSKFLEQVAKWKHTKRKVKWAEFPCKL